MIYTRISDPEIRRQYEAALTSGNRIAGPAAALLHDKLDDQSLHCCQPTSSKPNSNSATASAYPPKAAANATSSSPARSSSPPATTPRLRARLGVEQQLIDDATQRGWHGEIERHTATRKRIEQLLDELEDDSSRG